MLRLQPSLVIKLGCNGGSLTVDSMFFRSECLRCSKGYAFLYAKGISEAILVVSSAKRLFMIFC